MKSRKKGFLCMGMLLLLTLVIAGCGDKKESNIKVGNEVYSLGKEKDTKEEEAKKNESEQKTYAVIEIDTEKQLIRLQNTKSGKISDYGYSDGTEFRDKYGGLTGVEKMLPGRIVKIGETRENGAVSLIQLSDEAWEQENVERFSMKQDQQMITVGKTKYYYDDSLLVFLDGEQISLDTITGNDKLRVAGMDKKIISVNVTSGHGFIVLTHTDLFEGGSISIGGKHIYKIEKDMNVEIPEGTYQVTAANDGYGDTKEVTVKRNETTVLNLDEYKGLSGDNDQSYRYFMNTNLFDHVNIDKNKTYVPNGLEEDSDKACADYNEIIRSVGGIDIQLLGIGGNGHIGFNEPGEAFEKETHCVDLTESTIKANARFFESMDEVPKQAYTMGIKNIMAAKKILLVATGSAKADALYKSLYGPITPNVPASILQLHQDVTVVADEDALSLIKEKGLL